MTEAQIQAWLDQEDQHVAQTIRKHGVFIQYVAGEEDGLPPTFAYTVGLFGLGHPELVILSVSMRVAHGVLNDLADRVRAGANLLPGSLLTFEHWRHRVMVESVPNPGEIVLAANRHYQRPAEASAPVYQLTYDDRRGQFPWDPGHVNAPNLQPRPGTWRA